MVPVAFNCQKRIQINHIQTRDRHPNRKIEYSEFVIAFAKIEMMIIKFW